MVFYLLQVKSSPISSNEEERIPGTEKKLIYLENHLQLSVSSDFSICDKRTIKLCCKKVTLKQINYCLFC